MAHYSYANMGQVPEGNYPPRPPPPQPFLPGVPTPLPAQASSWGSCFGGGAAAEAAATGSCCGGGGVFDMEMDGEVTYQTTIVKEKKSSSKMFCCAGVASCFLVVAVLVIILIVIQPPITTTTTPWFPTPTPQPGPTPGKIGMCKMWGDPHVETFDGSFANFYDTGEYWVVKSDSVLMQGRFAPTPYTGNLAATKEIAIGGPFMRNQVFIVGPMDGGKITFNGQEVLTQFPSSMDLNGVGTATYDGNGVLVDPAITEPIHRVYLQLQLGVRVTVFRWANHIDVRIVMAQLPNGQDGVCGNFNMDPTDDTTAKILARIGGRVPADQLLFPDGPIVGGTVSTPDMSQCDPAKMKKAQEACGGVPGESKAPQEVMDACIFDVCFGGDQYAHEGGLTALRT